MGFNIGNVKIDNRVVLAPMAGYSNSAFRRIVKSFGCGLCVCEMVSDKAIYYNDKKTFNMLYMTEEERPISQQIFGCDVDSFVYAAKYIESTMKPDIIDINMGCPVPKVALRAQAGSALLKDVNKIFEIVSSVVKAVNIPVTVKIRSGWDHNNINAVEVAKTIEEAGASAISIHGRTRSMGYSGKVDLDIIKLVKENVGIPVIGNGDITTIYEAKHMLDYTKCDAIMIGRGALGNPWFIKEVIEYIENDKIVDKPSVEDKINMIKKHFNLLEEYQSPKLTLFEMRSNIGYYLKGVKNGVSIKKEIYKLNSKEEVFNLLDEFIKKN